jgi:hypothetical protein
MEGGNEREEGRLIQSGKGKKEG